MVKALSGRTKQRRIPKERKLLGAGNPPAGGKGDGKDSKEVIRFRGGKCVLDPTNDGMIVQIELRSPMKEGVVELTEMMLESRDVRVETMDGFKSYGHLKKLTIDENKKGEVTAKAKVFGSQDLEKFAGRPVKVYGRQSSLFK